MKIELIAALKTIKDYCLSHEECDGCELNVILGCTGISLCPEAWDIEELMPNEDKDKGIFASEDERLNPLQFKEKLIEAFKNECPEGILKTFKSDDDIFNYIIQEGEWKIKNHQDLDKEFPYLNRMFTQTPEEYMEEQKKLSEESSGKYEYMINDTIREENYIGRLPCPATGVSTPVYKVGGADSETGLKINSREYQLVFNGDHYAVIKSEEVL